MKNILTVAMLLLACSTLHAADWYVATNGTGAGTSWADATNNLQGAITVCPSNYTVWVSNGTYKPANLTVGGGVSVKGKTGLPVDVILDGNAAGRVVTMVASSWLAGCTITNGRGGIVGGSVSNCIITGNTTSGDDGAGCQASVRVENSVISYNTVVGGEQKGGGVNGCVGVYNCLIKNNYAPYRGGGANESGLYNCTIVSNWAGVTGENVDGCTLWNCVIWDGNDSIPSFSNTYYFSDSLYATGDGGITNNPLFVSVGDFHLQISSPCINTGTNGAWTIGTTDLDGNRRIWPIGGTVDMGAYEYGSEPYITPGKYFIWKKPL